MMHILDAGRSLFSRAQSWACRAPSSSQLLAASPESQDEHGGETDSLFRLSVTLSVFACLQPLSLSKGLLRKVTICRTTIKGKCKEDHIDGERHGNLAVRNGFRNDWRTVAVVR